MDHRATCSNIVLIKGGQTNTLTLNVVYPSPATNSLQVVLSSSLREKINTLITDMTGRVIKRQTISALAGDNPFTIYISGLPARTYAITLSCTNGCLSKAKRFVKQ